MRERLKAARKAAGMTQQQVAELLGIGLRHYKKLESGESLGSIDLWDEIEDMFKVNQRALRAIHRGQEDNQ